MELTAKSRFTIWPLRQPLDSAAPRATNLIEGESSSCSATRAQVFVLPMSRAMIWRSFLFKFGLLLTLLRFLDLPARHSSRGRTAGGSKEPSPTGTLLSGCPWLASLNVAPRVGAILLSLMRRVGARVAGRTPVALVLLLSAPVAAARCCWRLGRDLLLLRRRSVGRLIR